MQYEEEVKQEPAEESESEDEQYTRPTTGRKEPATYSQQQIQMIDNHNQEEEDYSEDDEDIEVHQELERAPVVAHADVLEEDSYDSSSSSGLSDDEMA